MATAAENYILNLMDASGGPGFESTADVFNRINPNTFRNPVFTDLKTIGPLFDEQGQFTEEFKDLPASPFNPLATGQDDVLKNILNNIDRFGVDVNPLQKLILQEQLKRAQEGQKISRLDLTPLQLKMGLVNPVQQSGIMGFPEIQVASASPLTGILATTAAQTAAGQTPVQQAIAQQQAETQQKIIDEVKQSGGGGGPAGMVGTPTGPGQTRGPAGMGSAPSNNPTGFGSNIRIGRSNGGIVSLFGRF